MKFTVKIALAILLATGVHSVGFAQTAKEDIKEAGRATKNAAVKTGRATKRVAKKTVNKSAEVVEKGADKVADKTRPKN